MKKIFLLLQLTANFFAQTPKEALPNKITSTDLFSDYDIVLIDSLLMDTKYKSPLYETASYIIKDTEKKECV